MRRTRNSAPTWIKAKYASHCAETGAAINAGDECLYYPSEKKVYHVDSLTAVHWRQQQQSDAFGLADAGW
jgi:hypothetical protein